MQSDSVLGGGFHPALGEMVMSRLYLKEVESLLSGLDELSSPMILEVGKGCISKMNGQKRCNINYLEEKYNVGFRTVEVQSLPKGLRYVNVRS